jgi:hypothetical protein
MVPIVAIVVPVVRTTAVTPPIRVVFVIVVAMTRSYIDASRPNLYADVRPRRSGLRCRHTYESKRGRAD